MRRSKVYELLYRSWDAAPREREPGYTLLLLVPGDLPIFLRLAMATCAAQSAEHRVETLVLPDVASSGFDRAFERYRSSWTGGAIRVARSGRVERTFARWRKNPWFNCWLQFVTGVNESATTHAIWHDSDLFLRDEGFLSRHYETIRDRRLALLGLSEAWDDRLREEHGRTYMVSTWELAFEVEWARSFAPWEHRGHDGTLEGRPATFDITFLPQTRTAPERVDRHEPAPDFVHFNHTIGTYRGFQRSLRRGTTFNDSGFRVLLVRLLVDAFEDSDYAYDAPALSTLVECIHSADGPVTYATAAARETYPAFRAELERLVAGGYLGSERSAALRASIEPFDDAFAYEQADTR